jgi:hypothetical protein
LITVSGSNQHEISAERADHRRDARPLRCHHPEHQDQDNGDCGIDDVVGGDDARTLGRRRPGLQDGIKRYDEDAAGEGDAGKVDQNAQGARRCHELGNAAVVTARHEAAGRQPQVDHERGKHERGDGNETRRYFAAKQLVDGH